MQFLSRKAFTEKYAEPIARICNNTGIFPQTLIAMAIVESQGEAPDGNYYVGVSPIARIYNNYFGIKATPDWKGKTVTLDTPNDAIKRSKFRVYKDFPDSAKDFIKFLQKNPRYTKAGVFKAKDYASQIIAIAKAGYSESSEYSAVLTQVANKINNYIDKYIKPYKKNILIGGPIVVSLLIIGAFAFKKYQDQQNKKHEFN